MPAVRWNSSATFLEYPWVSIAVGPDPVANEVRGHARGMIAIGDIATGVIALGGISRGIVAVGGLAIGGITFGGLGIGILAFGGLALGYLAAGGCAVGYAAIGGLAVAITPWAEPLSENSSSVPCIPIRRPSLSSRSFGMGRSCRPEQGEARSEMPVAI